MRLGSKHQEAAMKWFSRWAVAGSFLLTGCQDPPEKEEAAELEQMVIIDNQEVEKTIADQTDTSLTEGARKE